MDRAAHTGSADHAPAREPLAGIVVFDISHAGVGPYATMQLAGMGATVIKFESPLGDGLRRVQPSQGGIGCLYAHANLGKRSVVANFKEQADRDAARPILERADVFVQNMRPGAAGRLGLGYDAVRAVNPTIVYVDSSAWGSAGPMGRDSGADPPVQAFSGFTDLNGHAGGRGEMYRAHGFIDFVSSQAVVLAALDGLVRRARTGLGQHVDTTMLAASLFVQRTRVAEYLATGELPERRGSAAQFVVPDQAFPCLDGAHVVVSATTDEHWRRLVDALGATELAADPRLATNAGRVAHRDEVVDRLAPIFATRAVRWWEVLLGREGVPVGRPLDYHGVIQHPQVRANRIVVTVDTDVGPMDFTAYPWRFDGSDLELLPPIARSTLDAALDEVAAVPATPPAAPDLDAGEGTLAGLTVVDLTVGAGAPLIGAVLSELGADVTKVETPGGDPAAAWGPHGVPGPSPAYRDLNRGKAIRSLDLSSAAGRAALEALLDAADVVVDDEEGGLLAVAGIDRDGLRERRPSLIHLTVTGFGDAGPFAGAPASELVVQAMSGTFLGFGRIGEPPIRMGADVAGSGTAANGVQAVLASLLRRQIHGVGQRISVSMLHSSLHLRGPNWTANKNPDEWLGFPVEHPTTAPEIGYRTLDLPITFTLNRMTDEQFEAFMSDFGMADCLDDPRFADHAREAVGVRVYAAEVRHLWERATSTMTAQEVIDRFVAHGCEAQRLNDYSALFEHPQIATIGVLRETEGGGRVLGLPWTVLSG